MLAGLDVVALETLELSYAPPFGSARDPVNYAGMIAADTLRGDTVPVYADEIPADALLLDVREPGGVPDRGPSGRQAKARDTLQGGVSADKLGDNRACGTAAPASASRKTLARAGNLHEEGRLSQVR